MTNAKNTKFVARRAQGIRRGNRGSETVLALGRNINISLSLTAQDMAVLWSGEAVSKSVCLASWSTGLQEECTNIFLQENPRGTERPSGSGLELQAEIYFSIR